MGIHNREPKCNFLNFALHCRVEERRGDHRVGEVLRISTSLCVLSKEYELIERATNCRK